MEYLKKTSPQEQPLLKAFVSGYTNKKMSENQFSKTIKNLYPNIAQVEYPQTKYWKGYAFINFDSKSDFKNFIEEKLIRIEKFDLNLAIKPYKKGKELKKSLKDLKKRKLKIMGIPLSWNTKKFESLFRLFGPIENCYISRKKDELNLQNGVVIFRKRKAAFKCFQQYFQNRNSLMKIVEGNLIVSYEDEKYNEMRMKQVGVPVEEGEEFNDKRKLKFRGGNFVEKRMSFEEELAFHQLRPSMKSYHEILPCFQGILNSEYWNLGRQIRKNDK